MIAALIIARKGSSGWPGKNVYPFLGRPLVSYPIIAAMKSEYVDRVFVSTDSTEIKEIALNLGAEVIDRPDSLATQIALSEDAFLHGYREICKIIGEEPELFVPMFGNSPTIQWALIDKGIEILRSNQDIDSAVTVSKYNMWSPLRAMKIENKRVKPFVSYEVFDKANCDRDSQGDTYFIDNSIFITRPKCMDFSYGHPPYPWIGLEVYPLEQWGGMDIDYEWQMPQCIYWLKKHGFKDINPR